MAGGDLGMTADEAIAIVEPFTKSAGSPKRLEAMAEALEEIDCQALDGAVVECGVWAGGNLILARMLSPARDCWGYDTFCGMPEAGEFDQTRSGRRMAIGKAAVSLEQVVANFKATGTFDPRRLRFIAGPVEHTLVELEHRPEKIALLRLDTDYYSSTKIELEVLWPLVVPGGIMIIDDFGHWLGARKAVHEYFGEPMPAYAQIDYTAIRMVKP